MADQRAKTVMLGLGLAVLLLSGGSAAPADEATEDDAYTKDWTSRLVPLWSELLEPLRGRPGLNYLEVGVYEGRTLVWMLENYLTHPTARATAIDPFFDDLKQRYLANIGKSEHADKVTTITGFSQIELRKLPDASYDVIYVDGSHSADDVLADAVLCWPLLKNGGLLIFDDYGWVGVPDELRPQVAIDAFITAYRSYASVVFRDYQLVLLKHDNPCPNKWTCTPIGAYLYEWEKKQLSRASDNEQVPLSNRERTLVETMLLSKPFGETRIVVDPALRADPDFVKLASRLELTLDEQGGRLVEREAARISLPRREPARRDVPLGPVAGITGLVGAVAREGGDPPQVLRGASPELPGDFVNALEQSGATVEALVRIVIGPDGRVIGARLVESRPADSPLARRYAEAVLEAVWRWEYAAGRRGGSPAMDYLDLRFRHP